MISPVAAGQFISKRARFTAVCIAIALIIIEHLVLAGASRSYQKR
jgi:hypothetical protein